jgi:hypothetical protein
VVGDDDAIYAILDGIFNILFGGDCNRNMIWSVYGIVFMIGVDVDRQGGTDLLSPRARGLSGFESMECILPKFPRHLKSVHKKAASTNCMDIT